MKNFFKKPYRWAIIYSLVLILFTGYVLLDTFVIPRAMTPVVAIVSPRAEKTAEVSESPTQSATAEVTESPTPVSTMITDTSYEDGNIKITIETLYEYDTAVYIAEIQVTDVSYLKTAFAKNTYGRNIKELTSEMAVNNNAIFAVNGDYYGFRDYGFVLRNGVLYRDEARKKGEDEALVIDGSGNFSIISETKTDSQNLIDSGAWQVLSFGPALIEGGDISVTKKTEVDRAMKSNPRTAIGQVSELHYVFIVSDGRTDESAGLSLLELAQIFQNKGCTVAYNLDGGGSATMWFNGKIINNPTDGKGASERSVSDIVYFGY